MNDCPRCSHAGPGKPEALRHDVPAGGRIGTSAILPALCLALALVHLADAGITRADLLEFNRFMEDRDLKAFLEGGGLRRIKDAVSHAIDVESKSAANACVRQLMPLYRLKNERSL